MATIHLSIVIFLPLVAGLLAAFVPKGSARWIALIGTIGVLAYWIAMLADYPSHGARRAPVRRPTTCGSRSSGSTTRSASTGSTCS